MKKKNVLFILALILFVCVSGCDILNPVIDPWWEGAGEPQGEYPFTHETYVVSFELRGGTYVDSINGNSPSASPQRVLAHAHASVPGLVENPDQFFTGWYKDAECTDPWVFDTDEANSTNDGLYGEVDDIITLYAGWTGSGKTVDFNINFPEESFDETANLTYVPQQEAIATGSYAAEPLQFGLKSGSPYVTTHVFTGWYIDDNKSGTLDTGETTKWNFAATPVTADTILYARWAEIVNPAPPIVVYTVKFEDNGAGKNHPPDQYVMSGEPVIAPYVTYKDGNSFVGWYKTTAWNDEWVFSGAGQDKADSANDAKDGATDRTITLYAKWTPTPPVPKDTFFVTFDSVGGKYVDSINGDSLTVSSQRVLAHAHVSVPGLVEKAGNYFTGWYTAESGGAKWDFANNTVEKDMTLFAHWAGSGNTVYFNINFPENGFNAETNLTYVPLTESIAYGAYAAEPLQFGLQSDSSYVDTYVFTGWYDAPTGGAKWNFAAMPVTTNMILYARWAKIVNPEPPDPVYTVTFDSKADVNPPPEQRVMSDEPVIAPYVTYRDGYAFGGWYKDAECTDDWVFSGAGQDKADSANDGFGGAAVDQKITLYAKWTPTPEVPPAPQDTFFVTFDSVGGKYVDSINENSFTVSSQRVFAHAHVSIPGLVEKAGNYFTGWYTAESGGAKWDFANDTVEKDMTLYAGWAGTGNTVDFDINFPESGFNEVANLTYVPVKEYIAYGAYVAEPLQFGLQSGSGYVNTYVFTGWYIDDNKSGALDPDETTKWNFAAMPVTTNMILYARWAKIVNPEPPDPPPIVYTVTFDSKADTNPPEQRVMSGEPVIAPYVTYRDGYAFGGWYKDAACTDDWVFSGAGQDKADSANDGFGGTAVDQKITLYAKWAPVAAVDILKDLDIVEFRYILFSGGQTEYNAPAAPGSTTNLTVAEQAANDGEIDRIAACLKANPHYRVMIVGHANPATEADKANPQNDELMTLSRGRAAAVKTRLEGKLLGSQYDMAKTPIIDRAEGGRKALTNPMLSRRVEIIVFDIITTTVTS